VNTKSIKILIVDDHRLTRTAFRKLFADKASFHVLADVGSGEEAVTLAKELKPDIILMDIEMRGINGLEATRKIMRYDPDIKVLILTAYDKDPYPARLLEAGAAGYLTKDCDVEELMRAIRMVMTNQRYLSSSIAQTLALKKTSREQASPLDLLSERELQVMLMLIAGNTTEEIAKKLFLSKKTINTYRYHIFEKLSVKNDVGLVLLARRLGLVT
jgi:two-component system invasion response regulator UvrY